MGVFLVKFSRERVYRSRRLEVVFCLFVVPNQFPVFPLQLQLLARSTFLSPDVMYLPDDNSIFPKVTTAPSYKYFHPS